MNMTKLHTKHHLKRFEGLALRDAGGNTVTCERGSVWLTMEGDARDVILEPGTSFVIGHDGLTILAAQEPSVVQVSAPDQSPSWWDRIVEYLDKTYGPAAIRPSRKWEYYNQRSDHAVHSSQN